MTHDLPNALAICWGGASFHLNRISLLANKGQKAIMLRWPPEKVASTGATPNNEIRGDGCTVFPHIPENASKMDCPKLCSYGKMWNVIAGCVVVCVWTNEMSVNIIAFGLSYTHSFIHSFIQVPYIDWACEYWLEWRTLLVIYTYYALFISELFLIHENYCLLRAITGSVFFRYI